MTAQRRQSSQGYQCPCRLQNGNAVMRRLAKAIDGLDEPAVEKIAKEQQEDPFQVLIATMLSAQTKDAVTRGGLDAPVPRRAHAALDGEADGARRSRS